MKKIILIGNPIAGGGALKKIMKAKKILDKKGLDVKLLLTSKKGDAEEFARQINLEQKSIEALGQKKLLDSKTFSAPINSSLLVIAAGGDGTYNEVANGLIYSDIPMAILPLGTTSVLAKELKIPNNINKALDIALKGNIHTVHLGKITCTYHSSSITRYFLLMAGIGFDAEAVYRVNDRIKKISGKLAYILSGLKILFSYKPSTTLIKYNSNEKSGYSAIIGKASCYGGNFKITPDARLTDPRFFIFITHKKERIDLLKLALSIILKRDIRFKRDISYSEAEEIFIKGQAPIQIDGDFLGWTPAKINIVKDALRLVY